jgi:hypothetical protein
MASHKGWDRHYPVKSVATSGGSLNLAQAQLALVDMDAAPSSAGLKIISDLSGKDAGSKFQLRVGKAPIANNRSQSSKAWSTETFKISEVIDLKVDAPKEGIVTDEFIIGYDGFNANTAIELVNGDNEEISITLCGEVIGAIGYQAAEVEIKEYLTAPNSGSFTNQELVTKAVERLNSYKLMGDIPLTDYVEITPVDSERTTTGTLVSIYTLTVADNGTYSDLAAVQSQYNGFVVKRVSYDFNESVYSIMTDVAAATVTAGSFVVGQEYEIVTTGDTDFTLIGAADSNPGTRFVATGVGAGTGTAIEVLVGAAVFNKEFKVKGCADCPAGYSLYSDGFIYSVDLEDDGGDSTATVETLPGAEVNSAVLVAVNAGVSTYTVVVDDQLTADEIDTFVRDNPTAVVSLVSEKSVAEVCAPDSSISINWVLSSEDCRVTVETYTLQLADDVCGTSRLAELQAAYDELTIVQGASALCQTQYTADVTSNVVCAQCDPKLLALFSTEAPEPYRGSEWTKADPVWSDTALMGIRFKAKEIVLAGSEEYRDDMPFIATSARIKVAGGAYTNVNESFNVGTNGRFAGKILSIASEPENFGGNLREFEDITKRYEEGVSRHEGNNYGKWILGEETQLDAVTPYVDYILTIKRDSYSQSFSGLKSETINYHFLVAPGRHVAVEDLLNAIAGKAGVGPVQAFAKDA